MVKTLKKILIVEDEFSIFNPLRLKLEKENFQVLLANNGKKGLALALKEVPDLILLDIVMPVMNGIAMIEKLRQDKVGRKINVIVLTNLTHLSGDKNITENTVSDYLIKSEWSLGDLIKKIKKIIK